MQKLHKFIIIGCLLAVITPVCAQDLIELVVADWGLLSSFQTQYEQYSAGTDYPTVLTHQAPFMTEMDDPYHFMRAGGVDVMVLPSAIIANDRYRLLQFIAPFDFSLQDQYPEIHPALLTHPVYLKEWYFGEQLYGIPFRGDIQTILYKKSAFPDGPPDSWAILWESLYKRKIGAFPEVQSEFNMGAVLLSLGYPHELAYDKDAIGNIDWTKLFRPLVELARNVHSLYEWWPTNDITENCVLVYNMGNMIPFMNRDTWAVSLPKEGGQLWIDVFVVSKQTKLNNRKYQAALQYIKYMLGEKIQTRVFREHSYAPVNYQVLTTLDQETDDPRICIEFYENNAGTYMKHQDQPTRFFYQFLWDKALETARREPLLP